MASHIGRRKFLATLGGAAAAWPLAARAQPPAMPAIGFLHFASDTLPDRLRGFRQGLKDTGYVEGENVAIVYRWAEDQIDRLPELVAELARRQVAVLVTIGNATTLAAKASTTIPIVFNVNEDPVRLGLVVSLSRPGGSLTGVNFLAGELAAKRLELLHELVPAATRVAVFVNPANATTAESTLRDVTPGHPPRQTSPHRACRFSRHSRRPLRALGGGARGLLRPCGVKNAPTERKGRRGRCRCNPYSLRRQSPMPLALTDAELQAVFDACRPLQPRDRDAFLKDLAEEITRMQVVGPGALHRVIATVQRRHFDPPNLGSNKGAPRRYAPRTAVEA